jgi:methylamine dehydrogenase heavy chain
MNTVWTALSACALVGGALLPLPHAVAAEGSQADAAKAAPLEFEQATVETLGPAQPHWILVNDFNALGPMDSKVYLFDADSGSTLGMLSTGGWRNAVETAPDFSMIYSPETYYPRGTRGDRTDVVTFYDARTLGVAGEAIIPPKRATGMPQRAYNGLSDDGRFVYVANMTPATSVSVVDTHSRTLATEIETAGCTLVYPFGNRSFGSLCGDGTLQVLTVDDAGQLATRTRSKRFFDPDTDPVTEKAARLGDTWYYFSFEGYAHPVTFAGQDVQVGERWSLFDDAERNAGWRVGGLGFAAIHQATGRLYVIVHRGAADTHKEPGEEIRVYDLEQRKRIQTIALAAPAATVAVSRDAAPLLYTTTLSTPAIMVYDALTGQHLRVIEGPPFNPTHVQTP